MVVKKETTSGYDGFLKSVQELCKNDVQLNVYFTGQKTEKGVSWCPDCNDAEPNVLKALEEHGDKNSVFLVVDVGDRAFWKDMKNPFRLNNDIKLEVIPTLLRWKSVARLNGDQCTKLNLLEMFFTEEAD